MNDGGRKTGLSIGRGAGGCSTRRRQEHAGDMPEIGTRRSRARRFFSACVYRPTIDDFAVAYGEQIAELQEHRLGLCRAEEDLIVNAQAGGRRARRHLLIAAVPEQGIALQAARRLVLGLPVPAVEEIRPTLVDVPPGKQARPDADRRLAWRTSRSVGRCRASKSRARRRGFDNRYPPYSAVPVPR